MGCIRVDKIVDYMEEPLRKTLRDESPYVRKTAAICVAKFFDLNPKVCIENGFLEILQEMIGDSNPMVVANSVQALSEIGESDPDTNALTVTPATLKKLLMALNECTEWVYMLEFGGDAGLMGEQMGPSHDTHYTRGLQDGRCKGEGTHM